MMNLQISVAPLQALLRVTVLGCLLGLASQASAEPWLKFCISEFECGYKTPSDVIKIDPDNLLSFSAPLVLTDAMRASDDVLFRFSKDKVRNGTVGYMNAKGEIKIPQIFTRGRTRAFENSTAIVFIDEEYSLVKRDGTVSRLRAEFISQLESDPPAFLVRRNGKAEIVDFNGDSLNGEKYEKLPKWNDKSRRITSRLNGKFGLIDFQGREILPPIYDNVITSDVPYVHVIKGEKHALFDISGKPLTDFIYDGLWLPADGSVENNAVAVAKDGKTGLIDFDGQPLTELMFELPESTRSEDADRYRLYSLAFSEGLGGYFKNEGVGYINANGDKVLSHRNFVFAERFKDGLARVKLNNFKYAAIDQDGNIIMKGEKKTRLPIGSGDYIFFKKKDKRGLMTRKGQVIIKEGNLNLITLYDDAFVDFVNKKKYGLMKFDKSLENTHDDLIEVVPPIFKSVRVEDGFIFVNFDEQTHPMTLDGTPIGFSLADVGVK